MSSLQLQFIHRIAILGFLAVVFSSQASAQGDSTTIYFPLVFFAEILPPSTTLVSLSASGEQSKDDVLSPSISADGRFVAFESMAGNLVSGDTNGHWDIFVHDRQTGETTRVSVATDGTEGNSLSRYPSISADGRFVVFESWADNLVSNDNNDLCYDAIHPDFVECIDIFVHDRQTGETSLVSVDSAGNQADQWSFYASISADGRFVAFSSIANNLVNGDDNSDLDIFVHDRESGETSLVSVASDGRQADGPSYFPSFSADGRFVAFESSAPSLVSGDDNNTGDIFVHDRLSGETERVSVASDGTEGNDLSRDPSINADGRYIVFESYADNLVSGDNNGKRDVFLHDRQLNQTSLVSVNSGGQHGNWNSFSPSISAEGRYVAFASGSSNLVPGDTNKCPDIFVRDMQTMSTSRVSIAHDNSQANWFSRFPSISGDGRSVAFESWATNLVGDDTNEKGDIYIRDRGSAGGP